VLTLTIEKGLVKLKPSLLFFCLLPFWQFVYRFVYRLCTNFYSFLCFLPFLILCTTFYGRNYFRDYLHHAPDMYFVYHKKPRLVYLDLMILCSLMISKTCSVVIEAEFPRFCYIMHINILITKLFFWEFKFDTNKK